MSSTMYFKTETDLTDQWMDYLVQEAHDLADKSELEIHHYADKEILNPQVMDFLANDGEEGIAALEVESEELTLSFHASEAIRPLGISFKFKKMKKKIRKVFCKVIKDLEGLDLKDIIKGVLLALIPAFAGGLPAVLLPIVVALAVLFLKYGYGRVCPVV